MFTRLEIQRNVTILRQSTYTANLFYFCYNFYQHQVLISNGCAMLWAFSYFIGWNILEAT